MSTRRIVGWIVALGLAALLYIVSIIVTGLHNRNGAWLLLVVVFVFAAIDMAVSSASPAQSDEE